MTLRTVVGVVTVLATLLVGSASADDLGAARARRAELQQRLDAAAEQLASLEARAAELGAERDAVAGQLAELQGEIATAEGRVSERVRALYKRGTVDPVLAMLTTEEPQQALDRATAVIGLVRDDRVVSEQASAERVRAGALADRRATTQTELDAAVEAQRDVSAQLQDDLRQAVELERQLEEEVRRAREEARRRAEEDTRRRAQEASRRRAGAASSRHAAASVSPPSRAAAPTSGSYACPVGQPRSYTDSWGDARSGGRRHRGTDILAPYGTPIFAVTDGVVDIYPYGSSAGNWAIFRGADGNRYWYMHLQQWTVADGARVSVGSQIGTNGDTGNARGTPHLHFELHPGGGSAVNPYPFVRRICG
ncbi:MAG TPA: peptidoglycan DD-metalloendopeptidase family protein [Nitriliruptorales bacterium]|nr:peptidoglycan DD-metalloendopeptidase family protein [Nitriliruptorales bacterium]